MKLFLKLANFMASAINRCKWFSLSVEYTGFV